MRTDSKQIFYSVFIIIITTFICVTSLTIANNALTPYYVEAKNKVSEEAAFSILQEKYPDAYFPYKNLDSHINDFNNIDHIYKLSFTQKMPVYVYTITQSDLGTPFTYLVIFDALGYLQDIIFLTTNEELYTNDFTSNGNIATMLKGQKAPLIEYDATSSASPASNFIKRGINSAALNFTYEVKAQ